MYPLYFTRLAEPDFVEGWYAYERSVCREHVCTYTQDAFAFVFLKGENHA